MVDLGWKVHFLILGMELHNPLTNRIAPRPGLDQGCRVEVILGFMALTKPFPEFRMDERSTGSISPGPNSQTFLECSTVWRLSAGVHGQPPLLIPSAPDNYDPSGPFSSGKSGYHSPPFKNETAHFHKVDPTRGKVVLLICALKREKDPQNHL